MCLKVKYCRGGIDEICNRCCVALHVIKRNDIIGVIDITENERGVQHVSRDPLPQMKFVVPGRAWMVVEERAQLDSGLPQPLRVCVEVPHASSYPSFP